jgi:nicotinamide mononucleotide adenylyltransferase
MKESSSRGYIKGYPRFLTKTYVKMLKKNQVWNSKVRASVDEVIKMIPRRAKRLFLVLFQM